MLPQDWLVHPLWLSLAMALVHFLWQGTLVATVYAFGVRYFARSSEQRYLLGIAAMLAMATCVPLTMAIVQPPALPQKPVQTNTPLIDAMSAAAFDAAAVDVAPAVDASEGFSATSDSSLGRLLPWISVAWLCGVSLLSLRLVTGVVALRWLAWRGQPPSHELSRSFDRLARSLRMTCAPRLVVVQHVQQALAVGFFRPAILLPAAWLSELPPNVVEAVLAHELAHIRRRDLWVNLSQRVIEALLFFHPAVWWVSKQIRADREMCCDELAVGITEQRLAYASALEVVALRTVREPPFSLATGIGGRKMQLLNRVRNVLGLPPTSPAGVWWPAGVLALVAPCVVWLLAANGPRMAQADDEAVVIELTNEDQDARESTVDGESWLERLPLVGRLFVDDEEIVTELVLSAEDEEIQEDKVSPKPKKKVPSDQPPKKVGGKIGGIEIDFKWPGDKAEAERDRAQAQLARAKQALLKLTADEDDANADVAKRLAEAKRQLAAELERAHKLKDEQAAETAERRVDILRRELDERAADMKLQYAARQQAKLDKLKAEGYQAGGDNVHEHARAMHEMMAKLNQDVAVRRKELHQGIAEAAKNQQHDVVRDLHQQIEKLNAESVAAQHKMHTALSEKVKAQHSDRLAAHERQLAEHRNRIAAEQEKIEAHRKVLDQQRQALEEQHRQIAEKFRDEIRHKPKLADSPKVEFELKTEKLASPKPKKVEIEFKHTDKLANPKYKAEVDDVNRKELLQIVRELREELQDLRREVRELRGDKPRDPRSELKWPEGAPKPKLPKELDARKRKLADVNPDRELGIEIEFKAAQKAAADAALAGEKAAKYAATAAENFAKEATVAAEKVAKEATVAAEQVAKQAVAAEEAVKEAAAVVAEKAARQAVVAGEKAVKEAAAAAEKAAKQAADAIEKATEKKDKQDAKEETTEEAAKP